MSGAGRGNKRDESSEVEELLQAAEDEALLNLSVGSHSARSNLLDSDIAQRFEALKMLSSSSNVPKAPLAPKNESIEASISSLDVDDNLKTILGADLSARFAALKKAPSSSSSSSSKEFQGHPPKFPDYHDEDDDDDDIDGDGVSKKEVDKLIQWAMDAARLDPSVSTDDDDFISDSDDEEEEKEKKKKKKEGSKKKKDQN